MITAEQARQIQEAHTGFVKRQSAKGVDGPVPEGRKDGSDYNLHFSTLQSSGADWDAYDAQVREILGLPPLGGEEPDVYADPAAARARVLEFEALRAMVEDVDGEDEVVRAFVEAVQELRRGYPVYGNDTDPPQDEAERARYDLRVDAGNVGGGRFRKFSDQMVALLSSWARGEGDNDPLDQFSRDQLLKTVTELRKKAVADGDDDTIARLTTRRGASSQELKLALYEDVRASVKAQRQGSERPSAKFTLQGPGHRDQDVAVYRDSKGRPHLYRETDAGRRGALVGRFESLSELQQWADDNGEPRLSQWAAKEGAGKAPAKRSPAAKKATPAKVAKAAPVSPREGGGAPKAAPKKAFDVADVRSRLADAQSRDDAHAIVAGLSVVELKAVAKDLDFPYAGTKSRMQTQLVEHAVGHRLNSRTIRDGTWQNDGMPVSTPNGPDVPGSPSSPRVDTPGARTSSGDRLAAETGDRALRAAPLDLTKPRESGLTDAEASVLDDYGLDGAYRINPALREYRGHLDPHDDETADEIRILDAAFARSPLATDVQVERGISHGAEMFGDQQWRGNLTGETLLDHGYQSTTVLPGGGDRYAKQEGNPFEQATLVIRAPKGTQAIKMSGDDHESELLFQRGLTIRVTSDSGYNAEGGRRIEAEVVADAPVVAPAMMSGAEFDQLTPDRQRQRMRNSGFEESTITNLVGPSPGLVSIDETARPDGLDALDEPKLRSWAADFDIADAKRRNAAGQYVKSVDQIKTELRAQGVGGPEVEQAKRRAEIDAEAAANAEAERVANMRNPWDGPPSSRDTMPAGYDGVFDWEGVDPAYAAAPDGEVFDAPDSDVRQAVEEAWFRITEGEPGKWAGLADVRERLGTRYPFRQVSRVLRNISRERGADVIGELMQQHLTLRDRDGRVNIGVHPAHLLMFDDDQAKRIRTEMAGVPKNPDGLDSMSYEALLKYGPQHGVPRLDPDALVPASEGKTKAMERMRRELRARGIGSPSVEAAKLRGASPEASARTPDLDTRIRDAYAELASESGDWVSLARLRTKLGDVSDGDFDRAVKALYDSPDINLEPDANQSQLTTAQRRAAVRIGGEDRHILQIDSRRPRRQTTAAPAPPTTQRDVAGLSNDPAVREVQLHNRIKAAYVELAVEPGAWVSLSRLRTRFDDVPSDELDRALKSLYSGNSGVNLEPDANQSQLGAAERKASVRIGGEDRHIIQITDTRPSPAEAQAVTRQAKVDSARTVADTLSEIAQLQDSGASPEALVSRINGRRGRGLPDAEADRLVAAVQGAPIEALIAEIRGMNSEDAVERMLNDRKLSVAQLRELAERLGPPVASSGSAAMLRKNIAAGTAGLRHRPGSVFAGDWHQRPPTDSGASAYPAFDADIGGLTARVDPDQSETYADYGLYGDGERRVVHRVAGVIRDRDGKIAGSFRRMLYPESRTVHNDSLGLSEEFQRQGFATQFNDQADRVLADLGYTRSTVSPTLAGGYVWARRDYDWDSTARRPPYGDVPDHIRAELDKTTDPAQQKQMRRWLAGFGSGDPAKWPRPREIADSPMGERILRGAMWQGEKPLVRRGPATASPTPASALASVRDDLAREHNLTPIGAPGDTSPFNGASMTMVGGGRPPAEGSGQQVRVVRPGYTAMIDGERVQLSKAVVEVDGPAPAKATPVKVAKKKAAPAKATSAASLASARRDLADRLAEKHGRIQGDEILSRDLWATEADPARLRQKADGYDSGAAEYDRQARDAEAVADRAEELAGPEDAPAFAANGREEAAGLAARAGELRRQAGVLRDAADESDRLATPAPRKASPAVAKAARAKAAAKPAKLTTGQADLLEFINFEGGTSTMRAGNPRARSNVALAALERDGLVERAGDQVTMTDKGRAAWTAHAASVFIPADAVERIGQPGAGGGKPDLAEVRSRLDEVATLPQLRRLAAEMGIVIPKDRKFSAAELRDWIAEQYIRDRGRYTWR